MIVSDFPPWVELVDISKIVLFECNLIEYRCQKMKFGRTFDLPIANVHAMGC